MTKDTRKPTQHKSQKWTPLPKHLEHINRWAAGIDIGSRSHFVAVPEGCDEKTVREFSSVTTGLHELAAWLTQCGIETVAMESTGVYWIPLYELLEEKGFDVKLVDARQVKNVSGRKTDVVDCQWLQQLHTYGLLNGAFRPTEEICVLRAYVRQRHRLIRHASASLQHMQKALTEMNVQLHHVIADISGETGMKIIRAIVAGERDPQVLAKHRDPKCKNSLATIQEALTGHYREEHLFVLRQALELYDVYQEKIDACDSVIEKQLGQLAPHPNRPLVSQTPLKKSKQKSKNAPAFNLEASLLRLTGVNLMDIPGINSLSLLAFLGETGLNMMRWKSAKRFASWLGLSPGNKVSGGKRLSGKTKPSHNRAAATLRLAASTLYRSQTALGAFLRRLKARLGPAKAITATAHKIAQIIYNMLRYGVEYKETGQDYYEQRYQARLIKNLKKKAQGLGFKLVPTEEVSDKESVGCLAVI